MDTKIDTKILLKIIGRQERLIALLNTPMYDLSKEDRRLNELCREQFHEEYKALEAYKKENSFHN